MRYLWWFILLELAVASLVGGWVAGKSLLHVDSPQPARITVVQPSVTCGEEC